MQIAVITLSGAAWGLCQAAPSPCRLFLLHRAVLHGPACRWCGAAGGGSSALAQLGLLRGLGVSISDNVQNSAVFLDRS